MNLLNARTKRFWLLPNIFYQSLLFYRIIRNFLLDRVLNLLLITKEAFNKINVIIYIWEVFISNTKTWNHLLHIGLQGTSQTYFYNSQAEDITLFIVQFIDKIIHLYAIYINVCNIFATIVKVVRVSKSMVFKQGNFIGIQIFIDNKQIRRFKGIKVVPTLTILL